MSLLSYITPENCSREELDTVLKSIDIPEELSELSISISPKRRWFGLIKNKYVYLDVWLHDSLTDEADWNDDTWDFEPETLSILADFLREFSNKIVRKYTFVATWAGDKTEKENVTPNQLINIVKTNNIGVKTEYIVST